MWAYLNFDRESSAKESMCFLALLRGSMGCFRVEIGERERTHYPPNPTNGKGRKRLTDAMSVSSLCIWQSFTRRRTSLQSPRGEREMLWKTKFSIFSWQKSVPQVNGRSQRAIGHAPVESGRIQRERERAISHQPSGISILPVSHILSHVLQICKNLWRFLACFSEIGARLRSTWHREEILKWVNC